MLSVDDNFRISLRYIDPRWLVELKDELMPIFKTGRIKAFCSPVQSGSNRILEKMKREYTAEEVIETVNQIHRDGRVDQISTNLIVGFPGETEADLRESIKLVKQSKFGTYMVFKYEDRPNTVASRYTDKISAEEIDRRHRVMMMAVRLRHTALMFGG